VAVIGVQPIQMKAATFTVAADDYSSAVSQAVFTPESSWWWDDTLCGLPSPAQSSVRWSVTLGFLQDLTTTDSLSLYLIAHAGESRSVTLTPVAGGAAATATVMLLPAEVGGVPGQQMTAQVRLPVIGAPVVA